MRFPHAFAAACALLVSAFPLAAQISGAAWPTYGGDPGGQRYSTASQITRKNVTQLKQAWQFHTGYIAKNAPGTAGSSLETTPILFHGALFLNTPFDEVFALNPATGTKLWSFNPQLPDVTNAGILTSRGVAAWPLPKDDSAPLPGTQPCAARIFLATMDARLIALDATTGQPCTGFGDGGTVNLKLNVGFKPGDPYFMTSPPTVIGDAVIVGSGIGDNRRVDIESGLVRAYDARTGKQLWQWEPLPWADGQKLRTGAGNAWSVIAADPEHNLIFVPTGAPSPDFYGGLRPGDNRDANSVVALEASTGKRVWGFQVVHHDLWDYDVAAEPLLFTWHGPDGKANTPALAITTKQGLVFLLNRLTGEPLFPVEERPVPKTDIPGETSSPTQPFQRVDSLSPLTLPADAQLGADAADNSECRALLSHLRYEGIYTPPSLGGSLQFPGNLGGVNWGSASFDPATGTLFANTNRYAFEVRLIPHESRFHTELHKTLDNNKRLVAAVTTLVIVLILLVACIRRRSLNPGGAALALCVIAAVGAGIAIAYFSHAEKAHASDPDAAEHFGTELSVQDETPYSIFRKPVRTHAGHPCTVMPFGTVSALNVNTGKTVFQTALGTLVDNQSTGTTTLGGALVTGGGLVFTGASRQALLRAFDSATGKELWSTAIPRPAQASPMSYLWQGRQYIVIAAGGHGGFGTPIGDSLVAYALPEGASQQVR